MAATAHSDGLHLQLQELHSANRALEVSRTALCDRLGAVLAAQEAAETAAASASAALAESESRKAVSCIVARAVQRAVMAEADEIRQQVSARSVSALQLTTGSVAGASLTVAPKAGRSCGGEAPVAAERGPSRSFLREG